MKKVLLILVFVASCMAVMAQWNDNPEENNRITPKDMVVYDTEFKVTPEGLTYLIINMPYDKEGNIATHLQIITKEGNLLFPEEGKTISKNRTRSYTMINELLFIDKDNNAIIVVSDCRNASSDTKDLSYTIYKVSPKGEMLWGENGIDLEEGHANELEAAMKIIQLEDGSYVFAWEKMKGDLLSIQMQRLSNEGKLLWSNIELSDNTIPYAYPYLTNAGNNQFYLVYAKGSNKEITVRKVDFDGSAVWPEDTRVYRGGFPEIPLQTILKVLEDPNGGVFIGWYDDRSFTNKESTFVSYVEPDGKLGFSTGENGQQVGYSEYRGFSPEMLYDATEKCLYVVWRETTSSQSFQRIMAQKIAMTGELMWNPEGIEITPLSTAAAAYYSVQQGAEGEMVAFYMLQHANGYGDVKAYAVRLDAEGKNIWEEPVVLTTCTSEKSNLESSQLIDNSYWLTLWNDERSLTSETEEKKIQKKYMQKVNLDGTFGTTSIQNVQAVSSFTVIPSIIEKETCFIFNNPQEGSADISIYDLTGQKVATVYHNPVNTGTQRIDWDISRAALAKGNYIATLTTPTRQESIRIIVK